MHTVPTENELFFFKIHAFFQKNLIIRIFDYSNGGLVQIDSDNWSSTAHNKYRPIIFCFLCVF